MKKQFGKIIFYSIAMMIFVYTPVYAGNKYSLIMSYEDYAETKKYNLYYYAFKINNLKLFCFGEKDFHDYENCKYSELKKLWDLFLEETGGNNCIILIEGSIPVLYDNEDDAIVKAGGKSGLLRFLADQQNIKILSLEPDEKYLKSKLMKCFLQDEIAYRCFRNIVQTFHSYKRNERMQRIGHLFGNRKKGRLDLEFEEFYDSYNTGISFNQMKEIHYKLFETDLDLSDEQWFYDVSNPLIFQSRMNEMARVEGRIRDEFIINSIAKLKSKKQNVFISYNILNSVMQEKAIKYIYGYLLYRTSAN